MGKIEIINRLDQSDAADLKQIVHVFRAVRKALDVYKRQPPEPGSAFSAPPPHSRRPSGTPDPTAEMVLALPVGKAKENRSAPACGASCTDQSSLPAGPAARLRPTPKNAGSALFFIAVPGNFPMNGNGLRRAQNDVVADLLNLSLIHI